MSNPAAATTLPLAEMATHIAFEFQRFNYCAGHELFHTMETGELIRESFLIHFRNLLDFLYRTTKSNAKDALAIDYAPQWRPEVPTWLEAERKRCHKLLAHLTYERVEYKQFGEMGWNYKAYVEKIGRDWQEFISVLPPERQQWFKQATIKGCPALMRTGQPFTHVQRGSIITFSTPPAC